MARYLSINNNLFCIASLRSQVHRTLPLINKSVRILCRYSRTVINISSQRRNFFAGQSFPAFESRKIFRVKKNTATSAARVSRRRLISTIPLKLPTFYGLLAMCPISSLLSAHCFTIQLKIPILRRKKSAQISGKMFWRWFWKSAMIKACLNRKESSGR